MPNRLIDETSPYLLQHANNPVDWYPWGSEALQRAAEEDRPILLSVGYSACHWCHVMERESFEDRRIAGIMNDNFVCIKVDREERPDIDSIYMTAVQAMTGHGGWPMTVFLTPEGKPFYGGTYYPPEDRHGMPGFVTVIEAISKAYKENRQDITRSTGQLLERISQVSSSTRSIDPLTDDVMYRAYRAIAGQFDDQYGGIGMQPKFPQPMTYEFLLRYYVRTEDPQALEMVELTLDRMAKGGIYDQIGGGFHRYSTDTFWLVPHFEKMLYDNALLVRLYLHAYQVTENPLYRRIVEDTLDYVLREMTDSEGGFYSAQDADSEGVEGKFFIWLPKEIIDVLGKDTGEQINRYYGVTPQGNFEGRNILNVADGPATPSADSGVTADEFEALLPGARAKLLEARDKRVRPGLDDKILTAWNGMMLRAWSEAGAVLGRQDYIDIGKQNANFLLSNMRADERLLRTYRDGRAKLNGYLEDYALLIDGLIALHEATFEERWLADAIALGQAMVDLFWDESSSQFYDTGRDHEELIVRPRDVSDNAMPSGSSAATEALIRLAIVTGDGDHKRRAITALRSVQDMMARLPAGAGNWLCALEFYLSNVKEIAIIGDRDDPDTQALLREVHRRFLPNRVLVGSAKGNDGLAALPLLEGREMLNGRPTAYVCRNYVCQLPVTDAGALAGQLVD